MSQIVVPNPHEGYVTLEQLNEIEKQRGIWQPTRRVVVEKMEILLYDVFPVLDHGFIRVIDYMGDDAAIVQAARISYGRGTKKVSEDKALIAYLISHHHNTPIEQCEIKLHVKMPIFVMRQWIRHRMTSTNEISARYSILDNEFYIPQPEDLATQSKTNRQGRGNVLEGRDAEYVLHILKEDARRAYENYTTLLNENPDGTPIDPERDGLALELARMSLSLNFYTQCYWKIDLHNLLNFLRLRADSHAQYEIRVYADILMNIIECWVPHIAAAFKEHRLNAKTISASGLEVIRQLLHGDGTISQQTSGMSKRDWNELMTVLKLTDRNI